MAIVGPGSDAGLKGRRRGAGRSLVGSGSQMTPWASIGCSATRQDITLGWPSGLVQPRAAQTARAISARVGWWGSSMIRRMVSSSAGVKSRPQ